MISPEHYEYLLFGTKTCSSCGTPLPANRDFFQPSTCASGLTSNCRACRAKSSRASYERRRDKRIAQMREYYATRRVRA
jgi:hypothetical protein